MNRQTSFRDVEQLSAYLDDQLSKSEKAKIDLRLKNEPSLRELLKELDQSRSLLRKLPARRAPRNFTLTPRMAGVKPPVPRAFPLFRLASALAAVLLFFTFATNLSVPVLANLRASAPPIAFGMGGGGGGGAAETNPSAGAAAPAAPQVDTAQGTPTPEPGIVAIAPPTATPELPPAAPEAQAKIMPTPEPVAEKVPLQLPIPAWLQFGLLGLAVVSGGAAWFLRTRSDSNWFKSRSVKSGGLSLQEWLAILLVVLVVLALALSIYYVSATTFFAPVPVARNFPSGLAGGDKGNPPTIEKGPTVAGGDKGPLPPGNVGPTVLAGNKGGAPVGSQSFSLSPGLGFNFSSLDSAGMITAVEFQPDTFAGEMPVSYIPGLTTTSPQMPSFANYAFSLVPGDKNLAPQKPFTIRMDYDENLAGSINEDYLMLLWWNGSTWLDAAGTCNPVSTYERNVEVNRISVAVCEMGSYILAVP